MQNARWVHYLESDLEAHLVAMNALRTDLSLMTMFARLAETCVAALQGGKKLLIAGNGGSAADAQHWVGELVARFNYDRPGLPALALTVDSSILTAVGNDYGYEFVFSRQIEALGQPGDVFIAISTSGNSGNIVTAVKVAQKMGLTCAAFTGQGGGQLAKLCDLVLKAPSNETPRIQEVHALLGHSLCGAIEAVMFPRST